MADIVCPICDTFWRLYSRAVENLHELVGKHRDMRERGDNSSREMLEYEIAIAESTLHNIRHELRRHEEVRHSAAPQQPKPQPAQAGQPAQTGQQPGDGKPAGK